MRFQHWGQGLPWGDFTRRHPGHRLMGFTGLPFLFVCLTEDGGGGVVDASPGGPLRVWRDPLFLLADVRAAVVAQCPGMGFRGDPGVLHR